ncbi:hypothetical protein L2E82_27088 [Cichorium intybus]|uniref:Uncharacterized protein n=1 Tax=Cichorium intybus TaxID=13427 RepID=A0ACB9CRY2_CICIN|nr:hypothetical protein L2E82_27088 [Cichorium intybus]
MPQMSVRRDEREHTAQPKKLKHSGRGGDKEICCRLGYFNQNLRNSVLVSPPAVRTNIVPRSGVISIFGGFLVSGHMDISNSHNNSILWFFKHKGFDDKGIHEIFRKCKRLESVQKENVSQNWDYLKSIGIQERKLPSIVTKCPKIMTLDLNEKLVPMIQCLTTLSTKPHEVPSAITKFPHILTHSIEEKLCPLLGFFESLGVSGNQLGKLLLHNPRIISYSIDTKLSGVVDFLVNIGLTKDGMIGKILVKNPSIMGYNVEKRLRPTTEFLLSLGLTKSDLQRVAINFPEVICRDVDKILKPNLNFLKSRGFDSEQIASLVGRYPPILIKSVKNSLEPRIRFLVEVMDRGIGEAADYPEFFQHGLKNRLERREKLLKERNISCSLSEMLDCNHKKFLSRFDLVTKIV